MYTVVFSITSRMYWQLLNRPSRQNNRDSTKCFCRWNPNGPNNRRALLYGDLVLVNQPGTSYREEVADKVGTRKSLLIDAIHYSGSTGVVVTASFAYSAPRRRRTRRGSRRHAERSIAPIRLRRGVARIDRARRSCTQSLPSWRHATVTWPSTSALKAARPGPNAATRW